MKKNNTVLVIFLTFIITTAMYVGVNIFVPVFGYVVNNMASFVIPGVGSSGKISELKSIIERNFIDEPNADKLEEQAAKAYVGALNDVYSEYYTSEEYKNISAQLTGNYKGIGIEVTINEDNFITVVSAYKDAPAHKAGIKSGDLIIAVNGKDASGDNYNEAISMIRGDGEYGKNDTVTITLQRGKKVFDKEVTREEISIETVDTKMLSDNIGYVSLSRFAEDSHTEFEQAVNSLVSSGAKSLIIDLRDNPGGMLTTVVSIADYLLPKGKILTIKGRNTPPEVFHSDEAGIDLPMCVLINGASASASEVLAGALHDHKKATLVGEKSFGKGLVQSMFELSDGDMLKITTAKYYTPNDTCIDGKGIEPDYKVELSEEDTEDVQLNKAIEVLQKK